MNHPIKLTAERRDPPDLERFVAALVAYVLARLDAEEVEQAREHDRLEDDERADG